MKHPLIFWMSIFYLSFCWSTILNGQDENEPVLVTVETLERDAYQSKTKQSQKSIPKIKDTYRHHKALPATFEGTVIELTTSDFPLKRDYPLFKQFGQVYFDRIKDQGYSYCIIANFNSEQSLRKYLKQVIIPKASEAKLVEYKKGKRVVKE